MNAILQKETIVDLPHGFTARGVNLDDAEQALILFNRWSRSIIGRDELNDVQALRNEWNSPGFDSAQDVRVVFSPKGHMVGYVEVWTTMKPPVHPWIWGRIDPEYENMGIGTWLLQWAGQHAIHALPEVPEGLRFAPRVGTYREAEGSRKLFEDLGFHYIRSSYHMLIEMDAPIPEPAFPEGILLRTFNPETDAEAVYRADADAFRDHFGFVEQPFETGFKRFKHFTIEAEDFDPSLWFLAMDGDQIAGFNLCRPHSHDDPQMGWVGELGVRRPWRKQGLGLALLRHSFNEFYRRGKRKVGLGVDAQNLTGALRLYERAGMHVQQAFDQYEKELRPGREISVESLSE
ncbi:MAG: GNAT family N-acetyltransferase [Bacteroidota bacterium]